MALVNINKDQKTDLLSRIRRAKSSHIRWRAYAQGLVAGVEVKEDRLPVRHTDCQFGKWYYGEGQALLGRVSIYEDIEGPHEMLHSIYEQIFQLVNQGKFDIAHAKLDELIGVSRTLIEQIGLLEDEVDATF